VMRTQQSTGGVLTYALLLLLALFCASAYTKQGKWFLKAQQAHSYATSRCIHFTFCTLLCWA